MALPHPSMNFVPLDTLTASELNQIVANILALSNGTGIGNGAIKPEHLSSSILTISGSSEYTASNNSTVKFDKVSSKVGGSLSLSGNSIVVGAGVSKILVSASIFIKTTTPTGYAWGTLKKNNTSLGLNTIASVSGNFCSLSISPVLIDVSQGDKITAEFFDAPGGGAVQIRGAHSWLTAQVVA